jgi:hypothetical protein
MLPNLLSIPVEFWMFATILAAIAVFHHHTLPTALTGVAAIAVYKVVVTGFKTGDGLAGLAAHFGHDWVLLANLLLLC